MKKRFLTVFSGALILAMVLVLVQVSPVAAMKPGPFYAEYAVEMPSQTYFCPGFTVWESWQWTESGLVYFDRDGNPIRFHLNEVGTTIISRVDKPSAQVTATFDYHATIIFDEDGNWIEGHASGMGYKINITLPGYGLLERDAGYTYMDSSVWYWTPNWFASPKEVEAVCTYLASL